MTFTDGLLKVAYRRAVQAAAGIEVLTGEDEKRIDIAYESDLGIEEAVLMLRILMRGRAA